MSSFPKWWADNHVTLIHTDILRACEKAFEDAEREQVAYIKALTKEIEKLRAKTHARFNNDECWIYQESGDNFADSLVCPVVLSAEQFREFLEYKDMVFGRINDVNTST